MVNWLTQSILPYFTMFSQFTQPCHQLDTQHSRPAVHEHFPARRGREAPAPGIGEKGSWRRLG